MNGLNIPLIAHLALVACIGYSIICRARLMDSATRRPVRWQHGWLFAGCVLSLGVPEQWRAPTIAAGVAVFLLFSASRWRGEAPAGTVKPGKVST